MSVPYNDDTKEIYVKRNVDKHLILSIHHHLLGNEISMWCQLLTWMQAEEIYGEHWDKLKGKST
jgi:hypothetical protein